MNISKKASKQKKGIVLQYVAHFVEKKIFCYYLSPITGLIKNRRLNKFKFYSGFSTFQNGEKKNF